MSNNHRGYPYVDNYAAIQSRFMEWHLQLILSDRVQITYLATYT